MLSGKTQITVYWQAGTDLHKLTDVKNGDTVRARGLVFFTGSSFNMIARRIDQERADPGRSGLSFRLRSAENLLRS